MSGSRDFVTIVSGLPRSGTSMMMRMLEAGGLPVVVDTDRVADRNNPNGYYEFTPVKLLSEDASWMPDAVGAAVKIIYLLLFHLPAYHSYRVIFMRRDVREVVASQQAMMDNLGTAPPKDFGHEIVPLFKTQLRQVDRWLIAQPNIEVLNIEYHDVVTQRAYAAQQVAAFVGDLDSEAMASVVVPDLYRQRLVS